MTGRVKGHALRAEGAAYLAVDGHLERAGHSTWGAGYALCECGRTSPLLTSGRQRRAWHRKHKEEWA